MNVPKFFGFGKDKGPEPLKPMKPMKLGYNFDFERFMFKDKADLKDYKEERKILEHAKDERDKREKKLPIDELFTKEQQIGQAVLDEIGSKKEVTAKQIKVYKVVPEVNANKNIKTKSERIAETERLMKYYLENPDRLYPT